MTPNEYQQQASRTDKQDNEYCSFYNKLLFAYKDRLVHAHLGMSSETGEIGDCLKKHLVYGQELDKENLIEECGDVMWYISLMLSALDVSLEDCMKQNIEKLKKRYPEKFTEELAAKRLDKI